MGLNELLSKWRIMRKYKVRINCIGFQDIVVKAHNKKDDDIPF